MPSVTPTTGKPWSASINLHTGDYAVPSGVRVQEVRSSVQGHTTLTFTNGDPQGVKFDAYDIKMVPEGMSGVSQAGTAPALRGNVITLYGIKST